MPEEGSMTFVARARDEASPVLEDLHGHVRGLHGGLRGLSTILRMGGFREASHMVHLAGAGMRVGGLLGGLGEGAGGLAGLGGLGMLGPLGLGLGAVGLLMALTSFTSSQAMAAQQRNTATMNRIEYQISIPVDARGTATDHRALADMVAREVENTITTRARMPGLD